MTNPTQTYSWDKYAKVEDQTNTVILQNLSVYSLSKTDQRYIFLQKGPDVMLILCF